MFHSNPACFDWVASAANALGNAKFKRESISTCSLISYQRQPSYFRIWLEVLSSLIECWAWWKVTFRKYRFRLCVSNWPYYPPELESCLRASFKSGAQWSFLLGINARSALVTGKPILIFDAQSHGDRILNIHLTLLTRPFLDQRPIWEGN